jgi:hypothetical protein
MNSEILVQAVDRAIRGGATVAPRMELFGEDLSYFRSQTDVMIDTAVFDTFVNDLKADAEMAAFDATFANVPSGGVVSVGLSSIARLLLARAIASNDVQGTVERFVSFATNNATRATAVLAISGIKTVGRIKLGPDIYLIPITELPPSPQRGMALGQKPTSPFGPRFAIPSALTTSFLFRPVFYTPKEPQPPEEMAAHIPTTRAHSLLEEAVDLLSVLGIYPNIRMFWVQPDDWLTSGGMTSGWERPSFEEHEVPAGEVETLSAAYFSLSPQTRHKMLRIPLDRLSRAGREWDFADRAIDLGIALESLLLHDIGLPGELRFRLSLRGACRQRRSG